MKLRELLIGTAMMTLSLVSAKATTPPVPSSLITEDKIFAAAYYDTLSILSGSNECSDFFGGSSVAVDIFNSWIAKVRKVHFSNPVGIQMSGTAMNVTNMKTQGHYRLFDKVSINRNGPFYRRTVSISRPVAPRVGSFEQNTKEARVLMFLHELGHVVRGEGGDWLLPNDGQDEVKSKENTKKIEDVCRNQIKNLGKVDIAMNPEKAKQNQPDNLTPADPKP